MSACGSSFFVSCALLLYILYLSFFPFSCMHLFASFSPRLCEKNRKSWPALQHRFIYIFFSFFFLSPFSRVRLASDPSCSGFFVSVDFVLVQRPACHINEVTKSSFHSDSIRGSSIRETQFYNRRGTTRYPCVRSCTSRRLIREIQKFQPLPFNLKIISQEIYICKFKISLSL